ncbi:Transcriptional regulator, contains XRE-family HTH domain [Lachnospiraceae bacterium XBB2008]|nr:Transcriptional regulator, contains XRE-family HTH domain [Lachnospiraceae bacterium XBB2008]
MDDFKFAESLKNIRIDLGLSQQNLADMAGVTTCTISNYESGKTIPQSLLTVQRLADSLGVTPQELFFSNDSIKDIKELRLIDRILNAYNPSEAAMTIANELKDCLASTELPEGDKHLLASMTLKAVMVFYSGKERCG